MAAMDTKEVLGFLQYRMKELTKQYEICKHDLMLDIESSSIDSFVPFIDDFKEDLETLMYHRNAFSEIEFIYDIIAGKDARKDYFAGVSEYDKELYGLTNL